MFTSTELEWLEAFLEKQIINGEYNDYVAWTIDNTTNSYNSEQYDFWVLVSKEEITRNGLSFTTQGDYILVQVDSSSASSNYHDSRYLTTIGTGKTITTNTYNHIYTNVEGAIEPDIIAYQTYQVQQTNVIENIGVSLIVAIAISILFKAFTSAFPMKIGD